MRATLFSKQDRNMKTRNKKVVSRKFGKLQVEVCLITGSIAILGDWNSNFGHYYPSNFTRFKNHPKGEAHDWDRPQVIGMDWDFGLTQKVKEWLYSKIDKIQAD